MLGYQRFVADRTFPHHPGVTGRILLPAIPSRDRTCRSERILVPGRLFSNKSRSHTPDAVRVQQAGSDELRACQAESPFRSRGGPISTSADT